MKLMNSVRSMINQDGGVLLDINQGMMFSLNIVGSKIVEKLQRGLEPSQIIDELSAECAVSRSVVQKDVEEFLECLQKHALVEANGDRRN